MNLRLPAGAPVGDQVPVVITVTEPGGLVRASNEVTMAIEEGP